MKKNLLVVLLSCAAIEVFAQGVVQFRNYYSSGTVNIDGRVTGPGIGDPVSLLTRAALLGGPTTLTPASLWVPNPGTLPMLHNPANTTLTWVNFRSAPNNGSVTVVNAAREVPGVDWGGTALVQMVAWYGPYETWTDAYNAWWSGVPGVHLGVSNPLTLTLPTGPTDPNLTYLVGLNPFTMYVVREPTAYVLGALAAGAVVLGRKKLKC